MSERPATSFDVRIHGIRRYEGARRTTYTVRWRVDAASFQQTFATKKLAEAYRVGLIVAARDGEPFEVRNGLPTSMQDIKPSPTWLQHAMAYVAMKWPRASA